MCARVCVCLCLWIILTKSAKVYLCLEAFLSELNKIIGVSIDICGQYSPKLDLPSEKFSCEINNLGIVKANTTDVYGYIWTILTQSGTDLRIIFGGGQTFKDF